MSKEYIERGVATEAVVECYWGSQVGLIGTSEIAKAINNIPAADVVEVKHGRWEEYEVFPLTPSLNGYPCSVCGHHVSATSGLNYCPICGAKMDGEKPTWIPRDNWELGCEYECPYCGEMIDIPHGGIMPRKCRKCEKEVGI